jgi:flagellar biosynthesis/type III secretory pathway protein FliH
MRRPPSIPPSAALAVGGRIDPAVQAALDEARRIRDTWRAALDAARAEARDEAAARLRRRLGALDRWAALLRQRLRAEALDLAEALAARLVGASVHGDAARLLATARAAAPDAPWLRLRLHPDDADVLRRAGLPPGVEVEGDPHLVPGDVVLEGPAGRVDARAATRVAALLPPERS